jgi:cyclomaltodextrinase
MRLVLDIVLYHVGLRNPLFPEGPFILKSPELARLVKEAALRLPRGLFRKSARGEPPYETFLKVWAMPRLDYSRPEAVEYARRVVEFWAPPRGWV